MHTLLAKGLLYLFLLGLASSFLFVVAIVFKRPEAYKKTPFLVMVNKDFIKDLDNDSDRQNILLIKRCFVLTTVIIILTGLYSISYFAFLKYLIANP